VSFFGSLVVAVKDLFMPRNQLNASIACNYNFVKISVAIGQTLYAVATIYRTRGDAIDTFRYAAFGLTVVPYAWMSLINLASNLIRPEYPSMYLVESNALDELRAELAEDPRRTLFDGTVGGITQRTEELALHKWLALQGPPTEISRYNFLATLISSMPIAVIGGMTRFHANSSTLAQRVWMMTWLVFGIYFGSIIGYVPDVVGCRPVLNSRGRGLRLPRLGTYRRCMAMGTGIIYAAPAIGGFIVVGQMMSSYGVCIQIT
jgi:hypothetical protein